MKRENFDSLPPVAVEFLNYYSVIRNSSELTVNEYANDLSTFFKYIKIIRGLVDNETPFDEINISDISLDLISSVTLNDAYMYLTYCKINRNLTCFWIF